MPDMWNCVLPREHKQQVLLVGLLCSPPENTWASTDTAGPARPFEPAAFNRRARYRNPGMDERAGRDCPAQAGDFEMTESAEEEP